MYLDDPTQELKGIISSQSEKICKLNKKLQEFDSVVSERNELREIYKEFEQSNEECTNGHKKAFAELSAKCEEQAEKLKQFASAEYQWETKYGKLEDANNCMNRQIKILKCNENKLQSQLTETETNLKCIQKELCTTKSELEKKNCMVNKLNTTLKSNEQELCKVHKELEERKIESNKLNETNEVLNTELNCTKKSLSDAKSSATSMEERFIQERDNLTNELKTSCKKNNDLEMRYNDAMCKLNEERCKSKKFASKLIDLNKVSAKNHLEMKNRVQKLQDEISAKNNELCSLNKKVVELQQENNSKCTEINGLKTKVYERECQLKQMSLLSEKIEQMKSFAETCCCPKKKCEASSCSCPKKKCESASSCCPKKKCEPASPCCPKKKSETIPCCPKKKPEPCCESTPCCMKKKLESSSTTDIKPSCGQSNNTKAVIQKYSTKSNGSHNDMYKTELKQLKCDLEDLQKSISNI
ncbi:PREDICTED: keratin, type I cuticular Ha1 [Diuraphis noxia]|uniref:keratin, type I cuticular Ha1 n=1 Tax=Diuraphis noxia TaxID=143948 RepID=UPI000763B314|nr:PREDICTED: keratin, type I cuticular Ha1 [Diuraphis noxia]